MLRVNRLLTLFIVLTLLFGAVSPIVLAQESTAEPDSTSIEDEVSIPIAEEGDVIYDQTNSIIVLILDRLPLIALVILVISYAVRLGRGQADSEGFGDELSAIRQSKLFSDAEISYERVKSPASDMTIDTLIQLLTALIMIPFLPSNFVKGLQDGVALLRDLQDGPDGDEKT